jgi:HEPN domain-containing protein
MKKVSEEWLKAAGDDLKVMEKIASDEHLTHMVAFHAQQCIEKTLKAVIEEYEIATVKIHNLERLFELVRSLVKIDVDPMLVEMLDKLYIDARYPGDLGLLPEGKPTLERSDKFLVFAKTVHKMIKNQLKENASPESPWTGS